MLLFSITSPFSFSFYSIYFLCSRFKEVSLIAPVHGRTTRRCSHLSRCWYHTSPGKVSALPNTACLLSLEVLLQPLGCVGGCRCATCESNSTSAMARAGHWAILISDKFPGCICHEVHYRKGLILTSPFLQKLFVYGVHWLGNSSHQSLSHLHLWECPGCWEGTGAEAV